MVEAVYILCAMTCLVCAVLLFRGYARTGARFLLWSSLCFAGLCINNLLLFIDMVLLPSMDLYVWRNLAALSGLILLVYGLVWDAE